MGPEQSSSRRLRPPFTNIGIGKGSSARRAAPALAAPRHAPTIATRWRPDATGVERYGNSVQALSRSPAAL
jgi:hypothetical protein